MSGRAAALVCAVAGGGDALTGLLLLAAPALVLRRLGLPPAGEGELVLLRFVGVFVGCVGLVYVYPWLLGDGARRRCRLVAALEITAGIRLAVALFLGVAVARGAMDLRWLTVGGYDAVVATLQLGLLAAAGSGGGADDV